MRFTWAFLGLLVAFLPPSAATNVDPSKLDACPGYNAVNVKTTGGKLTADLTLAGQGCNVFGPDIQKLHLDVDYETRE